MSRPIDYIFSILTMQHCIHYTSIVLPFPNVCINRRKINKFSFFLYWLKVIRYFIGYTYHFPKMIYTTKLHLFCSIISKISISKCISYESKRNNPREFSTPKAIQLLYVYLCCIVINCFRINDDFFSIRMKMKWNFIKIHQFRWIIFVKNLVYFNSI